MEGVHVLWRASYHHPPGVGRAGTSCGASGDAAAGAWRSGPGARRRGGDPIPCADDGWCIGVIRRWGHTEARDGDRAPAPDGPGGGNRAGPCRSHDIVGRSTCDPTQKRVRGCCWSIGIRRAIGVSNRRRPMVDPPASALGEHRAVFFARMERPIPLFRARLIGMVASDAHLHPMQRRLDPPRAEDGAYGKRSILPLLALHCAFAAKNHMIRSAGHAHGTDRTAG